MNEKETTNLMKELAAAGYTRVIKDPTTPGRLVLFPAFLRDPETKNWPAAKVLQAAKIKPRDMREYADGLIIDLPVEKTE